MKKILINCFLICWLIVMFIDAAPIVGGWHQYAKDKLDPALDVTGLWQNGWQLFAPEPDKINVAVKAQIVFPDGQEVIWRSPDWRSMTAWNRFLRFREAEFIDNVRMDSNSVVWDSFSDFLARTVPHPDDSGQTANLVILTREWYVIPPPDEENLKQFPELPGFSHDLIIYAKDY